MYWGGAGPVLYYGWMDEDKRVNAQDILIDGKKKCKYSFWNCFAVFYIGSGDQEHVVRMKDYCLEDTADLEIYALNLSLFEDVIQEIRQNAATAEQVSHTRLDIFCQAENGGHLLLTVPYDGCWEILRNGEKIEPEKALDAFLAIPVEKGENEISIRYRYPYLAAGLAVSLAGCIALYVASRIKKRG